jgi:hypothetical protein
MGRHNGWVKIWDKKEQKYWHDEDGQDLTFYNETAAKNMMYTEGYTYEYMKEGVELHPYNPVAEDNSGYDLQ